MATVIPTAVEDRDLEWRDPAGFLKELTTRAWSPYRVPNATEPAERYNDGDDDPSQSSWMGGSGRDMPGRAGVVAWNVLVHDPNYAAQLRTLWTESMVSTDFGEFIMTLVMDAARAGALYARHVPFEEGEIEFQRVVGAVAALMGAEQLPDKDGAE